MPCFFQFYYISIICQYNVFLPKTKASPRTRAELSTLAVKSLSSIDYRCFDRKSGQLLTTLRILGGGQEGNVTTMQNKGESFFEKKEDKNIFDLKKPPANGTSMMRRRPADGRGGGRQTVFPLYYLVYKSDAVASNWNAVTT